MKKRAVSGARAKTGRQQAPKPNRRKPLRPKRSDASKKAVSSAPNQDAEVARLTRELAKEHQRGHADRAGPDR